MQDLAKEVLLKHNRLKEFRQPYEAEWKDITKFVLPGKNFWTEIKNSSAKSSVEIFDGTAIHAVRILANGLQGYMARKGKFFRIELDTKSKRRQEPMEYLQNLEDLFNWIFDRSNFYDYINEVFRTGSTIGTVVSYIEPVNGEKLRFHVCHPKDVWIAENDFHEVDTVSRELRMTSRDIVSRWDTVPEEILKDAEKNPYNEHLVIHQTFPRTDRDVTKIDKKNKKFVSAWVLNEKKFLLDESGFDVFPYVVWRWSTEHGGTYGRGPAHDALVDVLRSNLMSKDLLNASNRYLNPPVNVPQEKMDLLDLNPGGMNPYADPSRIVVPVNTGGSYPIGRDRELAIEARIKDHFMTDMFLTLNNNVDSKRTATEVMEMQSEKAAVLEPTTARIESEQFDAMFDLVFYHATMLNWVPKPPDDVLQILSNNTVKINYTNLMGALRDRYYNLQQIDQDIARIMTLSQVDPSILDNLDLDALAEHLLKKSTFPHTAIRSKRLREAIRAQRAQAQQEQVESENLQKQASALKDMSGADPKMLQQIGSSVG